MKRSIFENKTILGQPIADFPLVKESNTAFMYKMIAAGLSSIPFHQDTQSITRYIADQFPVHLAVHEVSATSKPPAAYTQPHRHGDCDEINIILSSNKLLYKIQLEEEEYTVDSNTSIWIPKGMLHAANVLSGEGFFITLRLN